MTTIQKYPYRNILLPVDFSVHSEHAAIRAKEIAAQYSAQLHLLHVVEDVGIYLQDYDPLLASTPLLIDAPAFNDTLAKKSEANLQEFLIKFDLDKSTKLDVQIGTPARSILAYAEKNSIDLIVMGSHGLHGLEHLLGSVCNHVLHKAPCDVLIAKE